MALVDYNEIAPPGTVDLLYRLADRLKGRSLLHINSTRLGGGVAEMLRNMVPLFKELGIDMRWEVIEGTPLFFKTTKAIHNALQGQDQEFTIEMYQEYTKVNEQNAKRIDLDSDVVVVHDPQPAALIEHKRPDSRWIWRCHIDVSVPKRRVWNFLKSYVSRYDCAVFSLPSFTQKLPIPQFLIYPSIDPLSDKNKELPEEKVEEVLNRFGLSQKMNIILQVSRFDRFKDPFGVIQAYKLVKKYCDCCLVLAGGAASDDPEAIEVLNQVRELATQDKDIFVLDLPPDSNIEINALQRSAKVILQKSIKEGFALTVAEAMWKGKPVVAGAVGGITLQIVYGVTGFTVNSVEGCAYRIRYLLNNPDFSAKMGETAKDYTRRNFLITRHICDYLGLMLSLTE